MFLIRLGVVALVILLFLPGPPRAHVPGTAGRDGFCDRYPKTCDASVEIGDALKHKLAYAVGWISEKSGVRVPGIVGGTTPGQGHRSTARDYGDRSHSRPWEQDDRQYRRGTLSEADRRPYWPETSQRRDVYPGR